MYPNPVTGNLGVLDEKEMDAGKPTLSGPDCTGCGANRSDSGCALEANEHERERERNTDTTHASYVWETKGRNAPDTNRDTKYATLCI